MTPSSSAPIKQALRQANFDFQETAAVAEIFQQLKQHPDLIVLDVSYIEVGSEIISEVKHCLAQIAGLREETFFIAVNRPAVQQALSELKADLYLEKSLKREDILGRLRNAAPKLKRKGISLSVMEIIGETIAWGQPSVPVGTQPTGTVSAFQEVVALKKTHKINIGISLLLMGLGVVNLLGIRMGGIGLLDFRLSIIMVVAGFFLLLSTILAMRE